MWWLFVVLCEFAYLALAAAAPAKAPAAAPAKPRFPNTNEVNLTSGKWANLPLIRERVDIEFDELYRFNPSIHVTEATKNDVQRYLTKHRISVLNSCELETAMRIDDGVYCTGGDGRGDLMSSSVPYPVGHTVWILGDVHGDLNQMNSLLRHVGLIDEKGHWTGKTDWLVQMGDLVDRGPDGYLIILLLHHLREEAGLAGGKVITLLGNHEALNLQRQFHYVSPSEVAAYDHGSRLERFQRWSIEGPIGDIVMRDFHMGLQLGDVLFVHAGLHRPWVDVNFDSVKLTTFAALADFQRISLETGTRDFFPELAAFNKPSSPLWTREVAGDKARCDLLDETLSRRNASLLVVGHTPTVSRMPELKCNGRLLMVDTALSRGMDDGGHAWITRVTTDAGAKAGTNQRQYKRTWDSFYLGGITWDGDSYENRKLDMLKHLKIREDTVCYVKDKGFWLTRPCDPVPPSLVQPYVEPTLLSMEDVPSYMKWLSLPQMKNVIRDEGGGKSVITFNVSDTYAWVTKANIAIMCLACAIVIYLAWWSTSMWHRSRYWSRVSRP